MFLIHRPSPDRIRRFLDESRDRPLSYQQPGLLKASTVHGRLDEQRVTIGQGAADFSRACDALLAWRQFDLGWVEAYPERHSIDPGVNVAVLIRHLGFWSLNGARVLYSAGPRNGLDIVGFAYGTLTNHAESGEELFEVAHDHRTGEVTYRIRAVSWPQSPLARLGHPIVRHLQARFRRDSAAVMSEWCGESDGLRRGAREPT